MLVNVLVGDVNDHWPQFQNSPYVAHVPTAMDPGETMNVSKFMLMKDLLDCLLDCIYEIRYKFGCFYCFSLFHLIVSFRICGLYGESN